FDVGRKVLTRLTTSPFFEGNPVWSPDGRFIAFNQNRLPPGNDLDVVSTTDYKVELLLSSPEKNMYPMDWSRDGRFLLCGTFGQGEGELFALPLDADHKMSGAPIILTHPGDRKAYGQFSPDGNWIAYESDRSGQLEIYIRKFPEPGSEIRVSTKGGRNVRWRKDGQELFYIAPDGDLMVVPLHVSTDVKLGSPQRLFMTNLHPGPNYSVSSDGKKFLMYVLQWADSPINMIVNWKPQS